MSSVTIESLELQVKQDVSSAVSGIDALSASLSKLKNAIKGGNGLSSTSAQLKKLSDSIKSINNDTLDKINRLTSGLSGISQIKDTSGLQSMIKQLQNLPKLANSLNTINWGKFLSQLRLLSASLVPLSQRLSNVSNGLKSLPSLLNRVASHTNALGNANNKTKNSYADMLAKLYLVGRTVRQLSRLIAVWIHESNSYVENLNLFNASMGEYAEDAKRYAETVGDAMGIDPSEWMRHQGIFMTITEGFGVASDRAYTMSKNLTQLGYDLSSFFNISYADAMKKLTSGISGELEPLRRLGYDLSKARLEAVALSLGIDKSFNSMTQAEKAQLRYYAIMTQVTTAQGDMARTLNAPANQLRILQAQVVQAARALGNVFIPALNAVLPYAIAVVKVIRLLANSIASLFGFQLPEIDYSGLKAGAGAVGGLADNANDASGGLGKAAKKAKELKNNLLGIDELNIISKDENPSSGGSGGGAGVGGGAGNFDFKLPEYDFLADLVNARVDTIVEMIKGALSEITAVLSFFSLAIGTILVVTGANIPVGLALMAIGAVGLASVIASNWGGMTNRLAETLSVITAVLGGFLLAIGAILFFTGTNVPLGLGLMVAGAVSLGTAVVINWKHLNGDLINALSILTGIVAGALLAVGALMAFSGANVPLGIALMAAGAINLATAVALNWDSLSPGVKKALYTLSSIVGGSLLALGAILTFSGVYVPLGIALMAAGAISIMSAVALDWNSMSGDLKKSLSKITTIVSGALLGIGAVLTFSGVATHIGLALMAAGAIGLVATTALNWGSVTQKVKEVLAEIGGVVGLSLIAIGALLCLSGVAIPLGIGLLAVGSVALASNIALNWDAVVNEVRETFKEIGIIAGTAMLALGVLLCLSGVGIPLGLALIAAGAGTLATGVALNWDTITAKVESGLKAISDKFGEFKGWVDQKLDNTASAIKTWSSNTKEWFTKGEDGKGIVEHFQTTAGEMIDGFNNKVSTSYTNAKNSMVTWGAKTKEWFNSISFGGVNATTFGGYANDTIEGFKNKISTSYSSVKGSMTQWASKTKEWFTNSSFGGVNSTTFGSYANSAIEGFKNKIGSAYTNTKSSITTWASKTKEWFTHSSFGGVNATTFGGYANEVVSGFKNKIGSTYTNTKSNMTTWAENVKNWFSNVASKSAFSTFASDIVESFKEKMTSVYTHTKNCMTEWANKVKSWFKDENTDSSWGDIAKNVVDGFAKGITSWASRCKDAVIGWGKKVISWFESELDIASPSKVFKQIGIFTVEGFNAGIESASRSTERSLSGWYNSFGNSVPMIQLAIDTSSLSYYDQVVRSLPVDVKSNYTMTTDGFVEGMESFYKEYVEPTINRMADDVRRQADKEESTVVQIGNRTITDAVISQRDADGYSFVRR